MIKRNFFHISFSIVCTVLLFGFGSFASASIINGTISATNHTAQVCEDTSCTVTSTSTINFGYFTTQSAYNVTITDSALTGYIWGSKFGWVVLNCINTTSGCDGSNGSFKVANTSAGVLSGYAWGDTAGWINFGPFTNSATTPVTINSSGQFNGYAWSQNFGWIKFDCSDANYCVTTDWRPASVRPQCSDGIDNDGDGNIDAADSGCNNGGYDPTDTTEFVSNGGGSNNGPTSGDTSAGTTGDTGATAGDTSPGTSGDGTPGGDTGATTGGETSAGTAGGDGGGGIRESISRGFSIVFSEGITPIVSAISQRVTESFATAAAATKKVTKQTKAVLDSPAGAVTSKAVATVGVVSGASVSVATALFANPLSFSELFLIPVRLWALLMAALGLKKRNRPWGTVYDSVTKQPLDPAYVVLQDMNGEEVATSITDLDGRYGFLMNPGVYKILAHKTNYVFPSTKLAGKIVDEIYNDLYFGETITVTEEGQIIAKNIPLDPIKFDWNEFAKKEQHLMKFYSRRSRILAYVSNILFGFGFTVTTIALLVAPKTYNIIIFVSYCVLLILKRTVLKPKPQGGVSDSTTGTPLSFAIVRVFSVATNQEIIHKITDKMGIYYCLIPNGTYYIKVERKNPDETYTLVHTSAPLEVKKGYIDEKIKI